MCLKVQFNSLRAALEPFLALYQTTVATARPAARYRKPSSLLRILAPNERASTEGQGVSKLLLIACEFRAVAEVESPEFLQL